MGRGLAIVAALLALAGLVGSAGVASASPASSKPAVRACTVGGPPLAPTPANLGGGLRIGKQLDIACGRAAGQRIALRGYIELYGGRRSFCVNLDLPLASVGGVCKPDGESWAELCALPLGCKASVFPGSSTPGHSPRTTTIAGVAPPGTARVLIRAGSAAKEVKAQALLGRLEGPLLEAFGENEPAIFFGALLPRCFAAPAVRIVSEGVNGEVLRSERGLFPLPHPCAEPDFPSPPEAAARPSLR